MSPEARAEYLKKLGYNPDEYELVFEDEVESTPEAPEPMSAGEAITARAKRAVVPALTGLAGAGYLGAKGSLLGPWGSFGGAIVGGIGGGLAGSLGQETVLKNVMDEKEYEESLAKYQQASEERPILSAITDIVPSALGLRPNLTGLSALKGARWGGLRDMSNVQKAALGSMAAEGVVGGAVDAGVQKFVEGRDNINFGRVATAGLGNALLSQPYGPVGNRLFPSGGIIPAGAKPEVPAELADLISAQPPNRTSSLEFYDAEADSIPPNWQQSNEGRVEVTPFDDLGQPPSGYRPNTSDQFTPTGEAEIVNPSDMSLGPEIINRLMSVAPRTRKVATPLGHPDKTVKVGPKELEAQARASEDAARARREAKETLPNIEELKGQGLANEADNVKRLAEIAAKPQETWTEADATEYYRILNAMSTRQGLKFQDASKSVKVGTREDGDRVIGELKSNIDTAARTGNNDDLFSGIAKVGQLQQPRDKVIYNQSATETPEFKKWFEGSKVVDKDGKPLRVYHGTDKDFSVFKPSKEGSFGKGIYLAPNVKYAEGYTKQNQFGEKVKEGRILPLYVNLKNPLRVEADSFMGPINALVKLGLTKEKAMALHEKAYENKGNLTNELQSRAKRLGYDGIIVESNGEPNEIIAFDNKSVKSAIGNEGTFDSTNPDIRYQDNSSYANLSPEDLQFAHELAKRRGVTIKEAIDLMTPQGAKAAGAQDTVLRKTYLNPKEAGGDTPGHEMAGHQFVEDMLASANAKDRLDAQRAIEAMGGDKEALAQAIGENILRRRQQPVRSWLKDFFSNKEDVSLARRAVDRKAFTEDEDLMRGALGVLRGEQDRELQFSKGNPTSEAIAAALRKKYPKQTVNILKDGSVARFVEDGSRHDITPSEFNGESIKTLLKEQNIKYSTSSDKTSQPSKLDPINKQLASITESLDRLGTKESRHASKVLSQFETDQTRYIGKYVNKFDEIVRGVGDKQAFLDYLYDMRHTGSSSSKMFNEAHPIVKATRKLLKAIHDEQRRLGIKVESGDGNFRDAQDNPHYIPNVVDPSVIKAIVDEAPNATQLRKDYVDFLTAKGVDNPAKFVEDYLNALKSNTRGTADFKAIRQAEGYGLPKSWLERDPVKLFERYSSKVARDFSFFKNVENDPISRKIFGVDRPGFLKQDDVDKWDDGSLIRTLGGDDGQAARARVTGQYTPESPRFRNVERLVRSGLLGTASAVKNHLASYIQMQPYIPFKYQISMIKAWSQIAKGLKDSMDMGVNRWDITSLELGDYISDRWGQKIANFLRTAQGYKHIEQYTRAHNMMVGELAAEQMWINAARGGREELAFFDKFKGQLDLDFSKPPSPAQIKEIAANFVERVQGSYNTKGLPSWLTNPSSPWYYIMSLSKWSVERANIIRQDVFQPAMKGNYGPLLRYTLGSILGGTAIRGISELLNNRKQEVPTYGEALASKKGDVEGMFYQTVNLLQMAGFAGIYADVVKMATDAAHGNKPRTPNVVSVDFAANLVKTLGNTAEAIGKGENSVEVVLGAVHNTLTDYIQALRLVANNTYKADDQQRADKFRDRRVWERLEDKPRSQASVVESNTLVGGDERRYKQTGDIKEARKILKSDLLPKYRGLSSGDRQTRLDSLRRNSYQVLPSEPKDLKEYLSYIEASQGKEAKSELVKSTARQKAINKAKSQMVPQR